MKAIKITIVAVLLAALGFGVYKIIANGNNPTPVEDSIVIPDGCDLDWAQQYIDSSYRAIPYGQFKTLKKRREEMQGNFNSMMSNSPKKCQETVDLMLRNRYQSRFIQMVNYEFDDTYWPHYYDIRNMNNALLEELSQGSTELKKIESICKEYGKVAYYNNRVKKQCEQRPSTLNDHWDFTNTRNLIGETPSASAPVTHTNQYESSRASNVKSRLYNGHIAFLESLVDLAKSEIITNSIRSNYDRVCEIVSKEVERFKENAGSLYGKSYSTVRDKADQLNNELDAFEKILD